MDWLKDLMRKNFSSKFQWNRMLWSIAVNELKDYFWIEKTPDDIYVEDEIITWYLKYQTLFVKTLDSSIKIKLYQDKKIIISRINAKFEALWYKQKISDIRLK